MEVRDGAISRLACEPPLSAKVRGEADGSQTLWLVSSGATLLEGDELLISLRLSGRARLAVRSVAAQLVHPCLEGGHSTLQVEADVADEATLWWHPEPVIVAAQADYRARGDVQLSAGATLRWTDELVLGRTGEDPRALALDTALRIDVDGWPRWRDGLSSSPGWGGPAVLGTARYVGSQVRLGGEPPRRADAWLPLAHGPTGADPCPGWSRRVLSDDPCTGRTQLCAS